MSLADEMADHDAVIFAAVGEVLSFGTNEIPGCFFRSRREVQFADGSTVGLEISFDCQWDPALDTLQRDDLVEINGTNTYRFQRIVDRDESGLTVLELGSVV